jgi:hypothetical protein
MSGSAGWEKGLMKGERAVHGQSGRVQDGARARMAANAGNTEDPGEPLVCPQCRQSQPTGLYCPDCDVELVGESFVDVVQPLRRPRGSGWIYITIVGVGITALLIGMVAAIFS